MAYDAESDRVILFGGAGREGLLRDTWAYDVDYDRWTPLGKAPDGPRARYHAAMAYSPELDRAVLHGGYDETAGGYYPEVWTYDYNSFGWTLLSGDHPRGDLARHAMVYSAATDSFVVFGGQVRGDPRQPFYTDETWALDLLDTRASERPLR